MSNYSKAVSVFKSSISSTTGEVVVPGFADSDVSIALSIADPNITVTMVDAATGKIKFVPKPSGFGSVQVTGIQDVNWPDGSGVFEATPHPITLGQVNQIGTNEADIGQLQNEVGNSTQGLVKKVGDLETTVGDSTSGLVKDLEDIKTVVGDTTSGLVKGQADLKTTVGNSTSGLVKKVNDLSTTVGDLDTPLAKGYFDTLALLQAADTTPKVNSFGYVKNTTDGYDLYVYEVDSYVDKGPVGGAVTITDIKSLINSDSDVHLLKTEEQTAISTLETTYQKQEADKGLSEKNYTAAAETKVGKLPTAELNTAEGLLKLDTDGKVPSAQIPSSVQLAESGKELIPTTSLTKLNDLAEIKTLGSDFVLGTDGVLNLSSSSTTPTPSQFTEQELQFIRTHLALDTWELKRGIQVTTHEGTRKKDSHFTEDPWIQLMTQNEDTYIKYHDNPHHYPSKLSCKLTVESYKQSKDKNKGRTYNFTLNKGSDKRIAWFDIRPNKDDWNIDRGDRTKFTLELRNPDTGDKYVKTYEIFMQDIGGRKIDYGIVTSGDSLSDVTKVANNSEWK